MDSPEDTELFQTNSQPLCDVYVTSLEELALPAPAVALRGQFSLNEALGGFRPNEFSILCGATGAGKTTLLANWSKCLIEQSEPHFVMSVETGHTDFVKRTMSAFLGEDINTGKPIPVERLEQFNDTFGKHYRSRVLQLGLYDNRVKHTRVLEEIEHHRREHGCKIVFIDNLNFLMDVVTDANANVEMDRVVHDFIMFVKRVDVHIVMVMHPKKTMHGRVMSEFDIKGSSTAVQEAQNVLLFNRLDFNDKRNDNYGNFHRELTFQKLRRRGGYVGRSLIYLSQGTAYKEILLR